MIKSADNSVWEKAYTNDESTGVSSRFSYHERRDNSNHSPEIELEWDDITDEELNHNEDDERLEDDTALVNSDASISDYCYLDLDNVSDEELEEISVSSCEQDNIYIEDDDDYEVEGFCGKILLGDEYGDIDTSPQTRTWQKKDLAQFSEPSDFIKRPQAWYTRLFNTIAESFTHIVSGFNQSASGSEPRSVMDIAQIPLPAITGQEDNNPTPPPVERAPIKADEKKEVIEGTRTYLKGKKRITPEQALRNVRKRYGINHAPQIVWSTYKNPDNNNGKAKLKPIHTFNRKNVYDVAMAYTAYKMQKIPVKYEHKIKELCQFGNNAEIFEEAINDYEHYLESLDDVNQAMEQTVHLVSLRDNLMQGINNPHLVLAS